MVSGEGGSEDDGDEPTMAVGGDGGGEEGDSDGVVATVVAAKVVAKVMVATAEVTAVAVMAVATEVEDFYRFTTRSSGQLLPGRYQFTIILLRSAQHAVHSKPDASQVPGWGNAEPRV